MGEIQKPPTWYWIVVTVALLWNLMGVMAFFAQDSFAVFGPGGTFMVALVIVSAIALFWFSRRARNNGWIG